MQVEEMGISGSWLFTPTLRPDPRGVFLECFTLESLITTAGRGMVMQQANMSFSRQGTVRGIHFASVPPSQAKYVICAEGEILDVIVDLRAGSPTFGQWVSTTLDSSSRQAVFISEGLGHAFCALSPNATVIYFCSEPFNPTREFGVHPLDSDLGLPWPENIELVLSDKDASAPTFAEAEAQGFLPSFTQCEDWYASLRIT